MQNIPKLDPDSYCSLVIDMISILSIIFVTYFINIHWFFQKDIREFENFDKYLISFLIFYILEALIRINIGIIKEARLNTGILII